MAALKFRKYRNIETANLLLNGALEGGAVGPGVDNIVGKTITFTAPAGTKTFTQGTQYQGRLTFAEIKSQLEGAIANLRVLQLDGKIVFRHASGTAVTLAAVNESGRVPLGLPNNEALAGVVYAPSSGVAPRVMQFQPQGDTIYVLTEE